MAAGLGFKTFQTGEVLTAADTNGYLMQGILVFASAAARTSAVTSPQEGQYSYLKDTNALEYYDGAAWVGAPVGDITAVTAGTGISGGGSSGAVTITNSMATEITAAGDIIVGTGSGTFDNLPIGSTGQVLTADTTVSPYKVKWAAAGGPTFTTYTPSWTNLTVGNGTVTAASATNGDLVSVVVKLVFGSTTSVSGLIKYSLPSTAHSTLYLSQFPGGLMLDSGSYYIECQTQIYDSGTNGAIVWNNINEGATAQNFPVQSNTSSTLPWTWAVNDQIVSAFTYRKA